MKTIKVIVTVTILAVSLVFATALSVEAKKGIRIHKKKTGDYQSTPHNR
ncbi:MAG: hypothetical protein ABI337_07735 [Nitrososphaera sp.]|jgi:hypothetical protein